MTIQEKLCHIKMEQSTFDDIQQRADGLNLTVSEYVRKAVRMATILEDFQKAEHGKLILRNSDGVEIHMLVIW